MKESSEKPTDHARRRTEAIRGAVKAAAVAASLGAALGINAGTAFAQTGSQEELAQLRQLYAQQGDMLKRIDDIQRQQAALQTEVNSALAQSDQHKISEQMKRLEPKEVAIAAKLSELRSLQGKIMDAMKQVEHNELLIVNEYNSLKTNDQTIRPKYESVSSAEAQLKQQIREHEK